MIFKNSLRINYNRHNKQEKERQKKLGPVADFEHCCSKEFPTLSQFEIDKDGNINRSSLVYLGTKYIKSWKRDLLLIFIFCIFVILVAFSLDAKFLRYSELLIGIVLPVLYLIPFAIPFWKLQDILESGIADFNNGNYEQALETFRLAQNKNKALAPELNDWVLLCLIKLQRFYDALTYIETNDVSAKAAKKMTIYSETNRLDDAINLFFEAYGDQIEQYPLSLIFPAKMIEYRKSAEAAIEFLDEHYMKDNFVTKNNYDLFEYYATLCKKTQQIEKEEKIRNELKEFRKLVYIKENFGN